MTHHSEIWFQKILDAIRANPGCTASELSRIMRSKCSNATPREIGHATNHLISQNLVRYTTVSPSNPKRRYYPIRQEEITP